MDSPIRKKGRPGRCQLNAKGCAGFTQSLEWHHESYSPSWKEAKKQDKGLDLDHNCHFLVHFTPRLLTQANKERLILARLGTTGRLEAARGKIDVAALAAAYIPPRKE